MKNKSLIGMGDINAVLLSASARIRSNTERRYAKVDYDARARIHVESAGVWSWQMMDALKEQDIISAFDSGMRAWAPAKGVELRTHGTGEIREAIRLTLLARIEMIDAIPEGAHPLRVLYALARAMPAIDDGPYAVVMGEIGRVVAKVAPGSKSYTIAPKGKRWALTVGHDDARDKLSASILPTLRGSAKSWIL